MPQEFHVVRCYSCETFQVHIIKKSNKWDCKMCGEKQSVKKVYFKGSGKDCRLNVQKLNETRILNDLKTDIPENPEIIEHENHAIQEIEDTKNSKWNEFLPINEESSEDDVEQSVYSFNRPNKRKSTKNNKENKKIKLIPEESTDNSQIDNRAGISDWKSFMSNLEKKSENVLEASKSTDLLSNVNNKKSKWNCFVDNDSNDNGDSGDEIPDEGETNASFNRDSEQRSSNIFNADDNNLDDILQL